MAKKLDTNSNVYTIVYACVVVVIVAFLLAYVSKALEPQSLANVEIDRKQQILSSLNMRNVEKGVTEETFAKVIKEEKTIGHDLPLMVADVDGQTKYIIPIKGKGLWGGLWGYISLNEDKNTVYGVYFSHESETAGLGALIKDLPFQQQFEGKKLFNSNGEVALSVVKKGKTEDGVEPDNQCDAVTGATLTSNGVDAMLHDCLLPYKNFLSE